MISIGIGIPINNYRGPSGTAPVVATAPAVSGLNMVGETLTTTNGTYTGSPVDSYTYQWQRSTDGGTNWTSIGTNATTYVLVSADSGNLVRCRVTAQNAFGSVENASNSINIVAMDLVNLQSYDASKFTLVGSKISVWADQDNTKSTWVQPTDSRRATLTAGVPVFPGGATGSSLNRNSGVLSVVDFTAYIVYQNQQKNTDAAIFGGDTHGNWFGRSGSLNGLPQLVRSFGSFQIANFGHTGNRPFVMCVRRSGADVTAFYNNSTALISGASIGATDAINLATLMAFRTSSGAGGAWSIGGPLYAACFSSTVHTDSQVQDTFNALYNRYGISSLTSIDRILCMGDSNTAGSNATSYAVGLGTQLGLNFANLGISGACLTNRGTLSSAIINRQSQMITIPGTDYISICGGTNDVHLFNAPASDISAAYTTIMTNLQAAGQNMSRVCISSTPYQLNDANGTRLREYRDAAQAVANAFGTKFFDLYQDMVNNGGNTLLNDALHLNQSGQNRWQAGVFNALTS